ncbi:uncharacterized protein [Amphiura filiformis]|uniref:uncharacterized protein n=1 Tax=Amphiura filiformis TaxID=82378 RepID=UPI003B223F7C
MATSSRYSSPIHDLKFADLNFHETIGEGGCSTVSRVTFKKKYHGIKEAAAKNVLNLRKDEVLIFEQLNHENIVKLLAFIEEGPIHLILLEYTPFGSLYDYFSKDPSKAISKKLAKKWATEAGLALHYLHQRNVIHRDIKSSNCLIFPVDLLKISDFGLAREIEGSHATSSEKGTWRYMAPEIHNASRFSKPSDIYAFGMLLLEIQSRELPFGEKNEWQFIVYKVVSEGLRPDIPHSCPKRLARLIHLCWKADPKKRPDIETVLMHIEGTFPLHIKPDQRPQALCALDHYLAVCMKHNVAVYDTQKEDLSRPEFLLQSPNWIDHNPRDIASVLNTFCVVATSTCGRYLYQFPCAMSTQETRRIPIQDCWTDAYCVTANDKVVVVGTVDKELIILNLPDFTFLNKIKLQSWLQGIDMGPHFCLLNDQDKLILRHQSDLNKTVTEVPLPTGWYCRAVLFQPTSNDEEMFAPIVAVCGKYDAEEGRIDKYEWDDKKNMYILSECIQDGFPDPAYRGLAITSDGCIAISFDVDSVIRLY